ncbi:MAG: hypothetical protein C0614_05035 [Desulfuromonas sp.]|nr:MAG: hypothetical protein C0614_05035 [Desulfuromonas sp.]
MIISASRRTDIPAFYSPWFMNRVRAGHFYRVNPFNSRQVSGFSLRPEHVDAFCFWSKNPRPLFEHLDELDRLGYRYYFQFTLNAYDRNFEPHLPSLAERLATFRELAERVGPRRVVWRYDPVVLTSATPVAWHLAQIKRLAEDLFGSTARLVFSAYDRYGKGQGRLHAALQTAGVKLHDLRAQEHAGELSLLVEGVKTVAERYGLRVVTCSEDWDLSELGIDAGACVDGRLIGELFGREVPLGKDKNQRDACNCVASVYMGMYNSCRYGCSYCYANTSQQLVARNLGSHDPQSPALLGDFAGDLKIRTSLRSRPDNLQLSLF